MEYSWIHQKIPCIKNMELYAKVDRSKVEAHAFDRHEAVWHYYLLAHRWVRSTFLLILSWQYNPPVEILLFHYQTKYSSYQQYLFNRIKGYREQNVSGFGWKQIGDILNSEGYKTPLGKTFKSNNVHSIYKKGKIREERLNSKRSVTRSLEVTHYSNNDIELLL